MRDARVAASSLSQPYPPANTSCASFTSALCPENLKFLERRITVLAGDLTLPLISISETGFTPAEHLDKHGKPYPKVPAEGTYTGGIR